MTEPAPQPADAPVSLGLAWQYRKQVSPVAGHLIQEPRLAAAAQQVTHQRDGQQLGIAAGRCGTGAATAPAVIRSSMST